MRDRRYIVICLGTLLFGAATFASQQSELLTAHGLVEFHEGAKLCGPGVEHCQAGDDRYRDALNLFGKAVQADSDDPYALYYQGVTFGRLGQLAAAIKDLEAARNKKKDLPRVALELGVALVENGQPLDALPWLTEAQADASTEAEASLYLGMAQLRLEDFDSARQNFIRAGRNTNLQAQAHYYRGFTAYRQRRWAEAEAEFAAAASASPKSGIGSQAAAFLPVLRQQLGPSRYHLFGGVGLQYDSNVVLAPSNEAVKNNLGISGQADGRVTLEAGGTYSVWRGEGAELMLGYDFFQSLYFELNQWNLEDHRPGAQITVQRGPIQFGLLGRYDYYFLRADSFLQEGTALPWITINNGAEGRTEIFYRMRRRDFLKQPYGVLDSFNHTVGVRHYIYLGATERFLALGYRFDFEDPINASGDPYGYQGNEVNGGLAWTFPAGVTARADYAFRYENYEQASAELSGQGPRHDNEHEFVVALSKDLGPHLWLTVAYFGTFNNSNTALFEYDRSIASIALEVRS